ncbi:hypothetical protein PG988_001383 [Apiospora saccharicola]
MIVTSVRKWFYGRELPETTSLTAALKAGLTEPDESMTGFKDTILQKAGKQASSTGTQVLDSDVEGLTSLEREEKGWVQEFRDQKRINKTYSEGGKQAAEAGIVNHTALTLQEKESLVCTYR